MTAPSAGARQAHEYPHRILLTVTGRTPQVVTETLYALACRPGPGERRFVPTEIHLITTAEGAQDARIALLDPKDGWFQRLCAASSVVRPRFRIRFRGATHASITV